MDQHNNLELSWSIGYGGSSVYFTKPNTICYLNSNCLKLININDGSVQFIDAPGDGIQTLAVNTNYGALAFSEDGLHARIFVYEISNLLEPHSILSGGDGLGYTSLAFANNSSIIASCSNIPQIQLRIWNWVESTVLCSVILDTPITCLSINPVNWRQVCGSSEAGVTLWTIAKVSEEYHLHTKSINLPYADGSFGKEDDGFMVGGSRPSSGQGELKLTMSSITGLVGTGKESFDPTYKVEPFQPLTHCWGSESRIYCSSRKNQLIQIDTETSSAKSLYIPDDDDDDEQFDFNCMVMHKEGLFAGGKGGILRCIKVLDESIELKFEVAVDRPITSFNLSPDFHQIVIGSSTGSIHLYMVGEEIKELSNDFSGDIVGIESLAGDKFAICRSSGLLQIGSVEESRWISALKIDREIFCLASSAASHGVFLGTRRGSIIVIDVASSSKPQFVFELFLHKSPVSKLKVDSSGSILVSGSSDGHLFILNGAVSEKLEVLGHTDISGNVLCLSIINLKEDNAGPWKVLAGVCSSDHKPGCNQLIEMEIKEDLLSKSMSMYMDDTLFLKDVSICKQNYLLKTFIYDIAAISRDTAYGIIHQGKKVAKLSLSTYENTPTNLVIEASITHIGHGLSGGNVLVSQTGKCSIVTISPDGYIMLRSDMSMDNPVSVQAGNYRTGGLSNVCFSSDARSILTTTKTGCISCWRAAHSAAVKRTIRISSDILEPTEIQIPFNESEEVHTSLEQAIMQSHQLEDQKYAEIKSKLRNEIKSLCDQVLSMIAENEKVAAIERLDRHEFNMDVEERQKLVADQEKLIKEEQIHIELEDTAKQYLHHLIKTECWDDMQVKGRSIKGFSGSVRVDNYPMKGRSDEELAELESCMNRRKVDEIEGELRKDSLPQELGAHTIIVEENKGEVEVDDDTSESDAEVRAESAALYGSLGFAYGGNSDLLQSQFMLHTKAQKRDQIILLSDCIYKIKSAFNKRFDDVYNLKTQEVRRIKERNVRLEKILSDMKIEGEEIIQVSLDASEIPENLLEVLDDEITVEKYIGEKERKLLEEQALLEEERRRAEDADNARERALENMMAGRLETNIEEELKEEIEEPAFMAKPAEEWTEEEQKLAKEHEKNKAQLNEEREKYRKSLETELKKLQSANIESMSNFDERLNQLFQRRIKTEMVILQEELKIVRLNASILTDEELDTRVQELLNSLEVKKEEKQASSLNVGNAKREVEAFKETYESLVADDRTLDRSFRKEFPELDAHSIDVLYKLFKKRPRAQRTLKAASESVSEGDGNPFVNRPSSSRVTSAAASNLAKAMQELDSEQHMPENIESDMWKKFIVLRRNKVEKEQQLKSKALVLADMNAYLQRQIKIDDDLKFVIEKTFEDIQRLREEKLRFSLNLEVQLLLKQGQVEVGNCEFVYNYSDSLLIHRSAVEDLNVTIKTLGDAKLASMRESKDFRKGIHQLAWQLKEMFMKAEDLQSAAQDLQMLRVTKELQVYLSENDQRQSKQHEIGTLEKTLEMYTKMHHRNIKDRKRVIRSLKRQIRDKNAENEKLDTELEELALCVAERKNINDVNADNRTEAGASKRMHDIITRRKLVDLAKAQANEIGMLRAEVERLRMRTFPALVQSGPM